MKSAKELIDKMGEQDKEKFLSVIDEKRPKFFEYDQKFVGISDMIECAFIWERTKDGYGFWEDMAGKYRNEEL